MNTHEEETKQLTDKEKLVNLFKEFGVEFIDEDIYITCEQGGEKVKGYYGFVTIFSFTEDGKFINMGAWE